MEKAREADRLSAEIEWLKSLHRQDFAPVERPEAQPPEVPSLRSLARAHRKEARAKVSVFSRQERAAARAAADSRAEQDVDRRTQEAGQRQRELQAELDKEWEALFRNEPVVMLATLSAAFEDNDLTTAPLAVDGGHVCLAMLAPAEDLVPERRPTTTDAGNLSLRKMTKTQRRQLLAEATFGYCLVTLRETFAVAPSLATASVVVMRPRAQRPNGGTGFDVVLAGCWQREALEGIDWRRGATDIATSTGYDLLLNPSRTMELRPVDLGSEPDLAGLVDMIEA